MATHQTPTVTRRRRLRSPWRRHSAWSVAAGLVALLVATPLLVVVSSIVTPSGDIWRHLWQTQLLELLGNTLALILGVGLVSLSWGRVWPGWLLCIAFQAVPSSNGSSFCLWLCQRTSSGLSFLPYSITPALCNTVYASFSARRCGFPISLHTVVSFLS